MTKLVPVLLLAALAAVRAAEVRTEKAATIVAPADKAWTKPWFCHDLHCPHFAVVEATEDWELRTYASGKWASTRVKGFNWDEAVKKAFWRLFGYISGDNEAGVKIEMTAPVRTAVTASQGPFCESDFTISFFVPPEHQAAPPKPSKDDVFIEDIPGASFYVMSYPGYAHEDKIVSHAADLAAKLTEAGRSFSAASYVAAGYDAPFRLINRHNEIWLPAADDDSERE